MADYKWNYVSVGGSTRIKISTGEDIRHLPELDKKLWTVLACPTTGLEIDSESLKLMDLDGNGKLRVTEVQEAAKWLCTVLKDPQVLFRQRAELKIDEIADEAIREVAEEIATSEELRVKSEELRVKSEELRGKSEETKVDTISLADLDAVLEAIKIDEQAMPDAPFEADVMAAHKAKSEEYKAYYELEKLQKIGLAVIPEDAVKPGMTEKKFKEMGEQIAAWEAAAAAAKKANEDALAAAREKYMPLRKLLLLSRDFVLLLHNFVTLQDFYDLSDKLGIFQAGTLFIDQRACHLCLRVSDMPKHEQQAGLSGMFLVYCDCTNQTLNEKIQVVAAVTVGEIMNLTVGKNAIFYDRAGREWDATIYKIIDNPISIRQAFWTPYRKFGNWVTELINKRAAEKEQKQFENVTANVEQKSQEVPAAPAAAGTPAEQPKPAAVAPFDIAKFAGIFAAIGMALGMIGTMLVSVAKGWVALTWWQQILVFFGLLLLISGPSMLIAWLKLRRRNLAPLLNANGWAVNADAIINVLFGASLTDIAKYPVMKLKDPFVKEGMPAWQKWLIAAVVFVLLAVGTWCIYKFAY
ncbi:MAG: hypothetical protein II551_05410 [Paludibacteraceae bacterium]|nr:hypothetical protein [Paludibacteraceae bacterium]